MLGNSNRPRETDNNEQRSGIWSTDNRGSSEGTGVKGRRGVVLEGRETGMFFSLALYCIGSIEKIRVLSLVFHRFELWGGKKNPKCGNI